MTFCYVDIDPQCTFINFDFGQHLHINCKVRSLPDALIEMWATRTYRQRVRRGSSPCPGPAG